MITLTSCQICDYQYSLMREHCPACGARRNFNASHSFERYSVRITAWDEQVQREVVKANKHTICSDEDEILASYNEDFELDTSWMPRLVKAAISAR